MGAVVIPGMIGGLIWLRHHRGRRENVYTKRYVVFSFGRMMN
jgi:hypothetical protein